MALSGLRISWAISRARVATWARRSDIWASASRVRVFWMRRKTYTKANARMVNVTPAPIRVLVMSERRRGRSDSSTCSTGIPTSAMVFPDGSTGSWIVSIFCFLSPTSHSSSTGLSMERSPSWRGRKRDSMRVWEVRPTTFPLASRTVTVSRIPRMVPTYRWGDGGGTGAGPGELGAGSLTSPPSSRESAGAPVLARSASSSDHCRFTSERLLRRFRVTTCRLRS